MPLPRFHPSCFRFLILVSSLAGVFAATAAPSDGAAGPARRPVPKNSTSKAQPQQTQGMFSFEAERIAMQNGCMTRDGVRPAGYLVKRVESTELYEVACTGTRIRVRCQFEYCELAK